MIIVVTGGRDFDNEIMVFSALDVIYPDILIHGGASGADALADKWAKSRAKVHICYPAEWKENGKAAGPIRNRDMLLFAQSLVVNNKFTGSCLGLLAFPGGRGTMNCVKTAKELGISVRDLRHNKEFIELS